MTMKTQNGFVIGAVKNVPCGTSTDQVDTGDHHGKRPELGSDSSREKASNC